MRHSEEAVKQLEKLTGLDLHSKDLTSNGTSTSNSSSRL